MDNSNIQFILDQINKENVLKAMSQLDITDIPLRRQSLAYDVLNPQSKSSYPPPLLIEKAFKIKTGNDIPRGFFDNIGKKSLHFKKLKDLGFKIVSKDKKNLKIPKMIFKKVPANEVGSGTEISILKTYFNKNLIDDPKSFIEADDNEGSKSFPLIVKFNNQRYQYPIKAYKTSNYKKDRRLILNNSNDPLGEIRKLDDYLCIFFEDKITRNSEVEIYVISKKDPVYTNIDKLYSNRNGLIIDENSNPEIFNSIMKNSHKKKIMHYPLNQIIYGPPGTGKTYSTITKALKIIDLEHDSYKEAQKLFQNELGNRIEFVTMHQSFSYEDFVQGLKPKKSDDGNSIVFDYKNGVFKEICERALDFDFISKHSYFPSYIMSRYEDELVDLKILPKEIKTQNDRLDYFTNLIDSSKGRILIKGPRDCFDRLLGDNSPRAGWTKDNFKNEHVWNTCEKTINFFKLIPLDKCLFLINKNWIKPDLSKLEYHNQNLKERELKPHVIILDEINRANISRVFGELIALIEKDKRDGKLTVTLPSGEPFTVPSNLHIIGTMNTADKSIALVDIALRRRFEFTPLYPDPQILKQVLKGKGLVKKDIEQRVELFTNLNRIIRAKKSVDFEIGHSYFMEDDTLINILNKQVLPLLNEYFMYDLKKVKDIIEKQQKDREGKEIAKLGLTINKTVWKNRGLLEVESINNSEEKEETTETVAAE